MDWATAADIDAVLVETLEPLLAPRGFVMPARSPRRWVHARAPLRDLFEVASMKGGALVPRWGLSLDFVPEVRGDTLRWHRTDKSARMDVIYDPIDFDPAWQEAWMISSLQPLVGVKEDAARVLPRAARSAFAWLETINEENLLERIERHRSAPRPAGRFGFESFVQQPLAMAFVLARARRMDDARRVLDGLVGGGVSETAAVKLRELLGG